MSGPPPGGPPPGGWQPPRQPSQSRLRPPWRTAPPGAKGKYVGLAILGFAAAWAPLVANGLLSTFYYAIVPAPVTTIVSVIIVFLPVAAILIDIIGTIQMASARSLVLRCLGWGAFIALLTHTIVFAISALVSFGICVSQMRPT